MDELKMRGMKGNAVDELLRRFFRMVFPVANDGMADRRKLRTDLVLQSSDQFNSNERRIRKNTLNGVSKLRMSSRGIARRAQLLVHSFSPKIVHESPCLISEVSAHDREVFSYRGMLEELLYERFPIRIGLGKEENSGSKAIYSMHNQCSLPFALEFRGNHRQSGWSVGPLDGHRQQSGGLIESDHGVVLVENAHLA